MSEIARANGWRGFEELGNRTKGGYEYRCDGMPSPMGCGESMVVTRELARVGIKRSGWFVCYGLDDDGTADTRAVHHDVPVRHPRHVPRGHGLIFSDEGPR